jgi:PadR family transcriptional regulator, regulatory protein AphA
MDLPTTSYAILGMLSLRPWTAYELTRQLRRSLDLCWPKAESVLYDEPKRLVRLGLATARQEPAGRRTRTVYEITGRGRAALADWLATRPAPPRFESEPLLRLLYADQGSKQDALGAVAALRDWTTDQASGFLDQVRGYLDDGGPFPKRLHIIALFGVYYLDLLEATRRWTELAETEIGSWPRTDGLGMTARTRELLEHLQARLGRLAEAAEGAGGDVAEGHAAGMRQPDPSGAGSPGGGA